MKPVFYVTIFTLATFSYQSAPNVQGPENEEDSMISKSLQPLEYFLLFGVDMADKKDLFMGTVTIVLKCLQPTSEIILDMKDLFLDENSDDSENSVSSENSAVRVSKELSKTKYESLNTVEPKTDTEKGLLIIGLEKELQKDDIIQIEIDYHKPATHSKDPNVAFVKYSYVRKNDENPKWVAVSMPGADNTRGLYPCIDEPAVRTAVRLNVAHDEKLISLTNTRVIRKQRSRLRGFVSEPYHMTPSLSPFSIGFVIGNLKSIVKDEFSSGLKIQISSDNAVIFQMDFAANTAVEIVKFYKEYFNSVHAIDQIDLIALPFYGRTDKWKYGLIILEESLIINENPSTRVRQIETVFTLCDVFCHQYFGPQTTFQTWSENWLNMGLALFYRIPCLGNIFENKETSIANIHLVESFIRVLAVNAEIKSRPLMVSDSRLNLTNLFEDTLLAETAYFLVRMMSHILGEDALTDQIKKFIAEYRLKTTSLDKLWEKFPMVEKHFELLPVTVTFRDIINSWSMKKGFAHIKIIRDSKYKCVSIQQESPSDSETSPKILPLSFVTTTEATEESVQKSERRKSGSKNEAVKQFIEKNEFTKKSDPEETVQYWLRSEIIEIPVETTDWIIFKSTLNVLCRVEYDPLTLKLIKKTLMNKRKYKLIDVTSRTQFISDLFASAEIGKLSYSTLLVFMNYLRHEKSVFPVIVALHELNRIRLALFGTEIFSFFQEYVLGILKSIIRRRKFQIRDISEDNYEKYYFKKLIFTSACTFGDENCIKQSKAHFATLRKDRSLSGKTDPIPAALREPFYCQAIKEGDFEDFNFLMAFYNSEHWNYLNDIILNALACTTESFKITKYLEWILNPEKIAPRDRLTVFKSVASNEKGYTLMRSFFQDNVEKMVELYSNAIDPSEVYRYLEILYENTWTHDDFKEMESFITFNVPLKNIEEHLKASKKIARKNISCLARMKVQMSNFFEKMKKRRQLKKALTFSASDVINISINNIRSL